MSAHQDQNATIRDQFAKQAASYARLVRNRADESFIRLIQALRAGGTDHALDVGCGTGLFTLALAAHVAHVTGIDLTPEMLAQARGLQAELDIPNVSWQHGDALPLPFADGTFQIVLTKATFHHFVDPTAILAQMIRVCAPGGRISVSDMTPDPGKIETFDRIERLRDPSHVHVLPREYLRNLGPSAGLTEVAFWHSATSLPAEAVLATSFPEAGAMEQVRAFYQEDAASGKDQMGLNARLQDGQIFVDYPMTTVVWEKH
jgi:ubiquinone/menaquinone biosynthesis C-methylase UbiE